MKPYRILSEAVRSFAGLAFGAALALGAAEPAKPAAAASAKPATNAPPAKAEIPVATFVWNQKEKGFGRDPFFPDSARFKPATATNPVVIPVDVRPNQPPPPPPPPPKPEVPLVLQGMVGRFVATINQEVFRVGEERLILDGTNKIPVRCDALRAGEADVTITFPDKSTEKRTLPMKKN